MTAEETVPEPVVGRFLSLPKESPRFLTSISQILVIFEPDSNLDAKKSAKSILYHCTIVPSRKSILHLK